MNNELRQNVMFSVGLMFHFFFISLRGKLLNKRSLWIENFIFEKKVNFRGSWSGFERKQKNNNNNNLHQDFLFVYKLAGQRRGVESK